MTPKDILYQRGLITRSDDPAKDWRVNAPFHAIDEAMEAYHKAKLEETHEPEQLPNAKDKAIQLLNDYAWILRDNGNYPEVAKQCAIIAVDGIIEELDQLFSSDGLSYQSYWQAVKKHLNDL